MEYQKFQDEFTQNFEKNGLQEYIEEKTVKKFYELTEIMTETNRVMNITALTTTDKIIPLHYADCVKIAKYIPKNARVADIGCGGGFPILPLAIVRPDLQLIGIDSTEKKIRYVQNTADQLGLNVKAISGRAEDLAKTDEHREAYDIAISRAVARLNMLDELCMPFVQVGGKFIAMKGAAGQDELNEALTGIQKLGGKIIQFQKYDLHTVEDVEKRVLIEIQKINATPKDYPRGFGTIKKKPL